MTLQKVCKADELAVGTVRAVKVNGESLAVYRLADGYYATQASCSHLFAPLAKGKIIDGCKIQCPFHRARFDIRTGEVVDWANFPPGIQVLNVVRGEKRLKTYPVTVADGWLQVEI
jgi:3-phenylpropionate/trans-cinnamate dioxygenase ferredoxin subunit